MQTLVAVVDDDESVRESLPDLLRDLGFEVRAFAAAAEFLASQALAQTQCLLLDIAMPGMSGPELQQELVRRGWTFPVIFISAQADEKVRSGLMAKGAVGYLLKPFTDSELRAALLAAGYPISNTE